MHNELNIMEVALVDEIKQRLSQFEIEGFSGLFCPNVATAVIQLAFNVLDQKFHWAF
jgi:hypothetical protein